MSIKFAKTKILATIGPSCDSTKKLEALVDAGCDAFRLNFSHGSFEYFEKIFNSINELCVRRSLPVPILIDLQGPKIRIGELSQPEIEIKTGGEIELSIEDFPGTKDKISVSYKSLPKDANVGETILINDGLIRLEVLSKTASSVKCKIIEGGILKPRKGMNLPGMKLSTPSVTEKDFSNLEFALKHRVDFIALSFVRSAEDIHHLKKWLFIRGIEKPIIAKIEKPEAIQNFDAILEAADGIMVARGDLGVELAPQLVPVFQKNIIRKCNSFGKLVITATQMLETMIENPVPTRAEASDIANAVWDGTDVVMLSGETSVGKFPVEAVKMMNDILLTTESQPIFRSEIKYEIPKELSANLFDSMAHSHKNIAEQINAAAIIIFTHQGRKAISTAKFRPSSTIFAFSDSFDTCNTLNLHWGIKPLYLEDVDDEDSAVQNSMKLLLEKNFINKGDLVIFTAGRPHIDKERRSWMRFAIAE
jgi:pyruvate kinase